MEFKYNIGDTVYASRHNDIEEYRVLARRYEEDSEQCSETYEVCRPSNTSSTIVLNVRQLYSDKEVAVNVLIEEENGRHEDRIRELQSFL